jgi:glucosamine--fructose-6-phosphate aminotransferase (isomerizing)
MKAGGPLQIYTEGATQALEYNLTGMNLIGLSNSGRTRELMRLIAKLKNENHSNILGITASEKTLLEQQANQTLKLSCGKEQAVAATKSVVEQSLVVEQIYNYILKSTPIDYHPLAANFKAVLDSKINKKIIESLADAPVIYFSGRNDGIAEELTIKTNEIARKKSEYLEGTYGLHGIEEVMQPNEVVVLIDPFHEEQEKFYEVLVKGVGLKVIAISTNQTMFDTLVIPDAKNNQGYLNLAMGWNLLVEIGLALNINLDKPVRARKIGNEYITM